MQAWNSVKVTNAESVHNGRAGTVMRVETKGDLQLVQVWLDATADLTAQTEPFAAAELVLL